MDKLKLIAALLLLIAGVFAFYWFGEQSLWMRVGAVIAGVISAAALALTTAPGQAAWQFTTGARTELRKVVWPTQRETMQATLMVIVMVILVGLYVWLLDLISFSVIYDLLLDVRST